MTPMLESDNPEQDLAKWQNDRLTVLEVHDIIREAERAERDIKARRLLETLSKEGLVSPRELPTPTEAPRQTESAAGLCQLQDKYRQLLKEYQDNMVQRRPSQADFADSMFLTKTTLKRRLKDLGADWKRDFGSLAPLTEPENIPPF